MTRLRGPFVLVSWLSCSFSLLLARSVSSTCATPSLTVSTRRRITYSSAGVLAGSDSEYDGSPSALQRGVTCSCYDATTCLSVIFFFHLLGTLQRGRGREREREISNEPGSSASSH